MQNFGPTAARKDLYKPPTDNLLQGRHSAPAPARRSSLSIGCHRNIFVIRTPSPSPCGRSFLSFSFESSACLLRHGSGARMQVRGEVLQVLRPKLRFTAFAVLAAVTRWIAGGRWLQVQEIQTY